MKKLLILTISLILCVCPTFALGCFNPNANKVNVKYYADASKISPLILAGTETIGLIPEPAVSVLESNAQKQGKTLYRMDLQELYDKDAKAYPQAVLMVKKSVIGAHQNLSATLQSKITESVLWAKENINSAVTSISNHGATTLDASKLSATAIDGCKIFWQSPSQAKQSVKDYVNGIIEISSASASAVNDDFFYANQTGENQKQSYTFVTPDGAPAIAISKLMNDGDTLGTGKNVNYSVITAGEVRNNFVTGNADFILAPVNMASQFYKTFDANDPYLMVAVITHGNFYIVSTEPLSVKDLVGKRVAVPNKGAVPDWTFQMALKKHGLQCEIME